MGRRRRTPKITGNDNVVGCNSGDIDFQGVLPKRKRILQNDELEQVSDRLSELPDSLLVEILSYLPMEDAVRTGILSKRWKTLWTLVDRIRFRPHDHKGFKKLERLISFVDHILMQSACPNLKEFSLCMLEEDYFDRVPTIEKWLQYVSSKNVKFLKLEVDLYTFRLPRKLSWFSLEKLSLSHITIYNEQIADILLGCPLLDTLILENLSAFKFNIASTKLRKLEVLSSNAENYNDTFLEINAPCLKELVISGDFCAFECRLVDVSSLIFAKVTFAYNLVDWYIDDGRDESFALKLAIGILEKLHDVEELIVGPLLIQALSVLKLLGKPSPLFKCKRLTIESLLLAWELPGVACLLQRLPHLETLVIQLQSVNEWESVYFREIDNVNGEKYLSMQKGNFQHLKNVRVVDGRRNFCLRDPCGDSGDGKSFEIEFVAYLLRNAYVLEKFVFTTPINNNCKCSINCALQLSPKLIYSCLDGNGAAKSCEFRKKQSGFEFIYLDRGLDK